ncbi:MAG: aminotransferase class V-fold PLP-dependent enzyme [Myxococcales bacterium]|nr:aminotransferase class V-fold PLP-dependent enzyme [Myxococcales bacterium]
MLTLARMQDLLRHIQQDFVGLDRCDAVMSLDGRVGQRRRIYLDSTATALMPRPVLRGVQTYFERASANSHTAAHRAGRATTEAIEETRRALGELVGWDPRRDVVLLEGNGATGAINFLARALFPPELRAPLKRALGEEGRELARALVKTAPSLRSRMEGMLSRPLVVLSRLEHHSNILPWVEAVGRHHVRVVDTTPDGRFDLDHYERILRQEGHRVRVVAVTGASNVTGVLTPLDEIAARAHAVGAQVMVDAAQLAPHRPIRMHGGGQNLDFVVVSGHKLYAPGSRGALIGPLEETGCVCAGDVGGGMVEFVSLDDYQIKNEITQREEAGTPNIPGTIALGMAALLLQRIDMARIAAAEEALVGYALERLAAIEGLRLYGPLDPSARVGVIALNVVGLHHAVVARYLDDTHAVCVRSGCFCAHPYVQALLACTDEAEEAYRRQVSAGDRSALPGMVRLSFGLYNTRDDVDAACAALAEAVRRRDQIREAYLVDRSGNAQRRDLRAPPKVFSLVDGLNAALSAPHPAS